MIKYIGPDPYYGISPGGDVDPHCVLTDNVIYSKRINPGLSDVVTLTDGKIYQVRMIPGYFGLAAVGAFLVADTPAKAATISLTHWSTPVFTGATIRAKAPYLYLCFTNAYDQQYVIVRELTLKG